MRSIEPNANPTRATGGLAEPPGGLAGQERKLRDLRRMKLVALAFLLTATVIFLLSSAAESAGWPGWVGYVRAAAEAGMVGALADWFAVTALFRYPLGIRIPHTAIIPHKKDAFGDSLGEFVGANFLSETVIREKVHQIGVADRLGSWLAHPENADRVTAEISTMLRGAITVLRDEDVQAVVEQAVTRRIVEKPWGPPLGKILDRVFADGAHHKLVDLLCDRGYEWVRSNHSALLRAVSERSPSWSPKFVDSLFADKIYGEVVTFAWAVKTDVNHPMRLALDKFLTEFAQGLQTDPELMARAEQLKHQVLDHAEVQKVIGSAWSTAKELLLSAAEDPDSELRKRMHAGLLSLGVRLTSDDSLRSKVDRWLEGASAYLVRNYSREILTVITETVQRWDAAETSRKIELQIGRDLQFIRINGTVVGAIAGVVIYSVAQLLF